MNNDKVLESLSAEDAQAVLKKLAASDSKIRKTAEAIAIALFCDVDADEIARAVFEELDSIAVEDVWDSSGQKRDGYVDPGDYAFQLFEEAIEPFTRQMEKCQELSLDQAAKQCCLGILKGIHGFHRESTTEFKTWAEDAPAENFVRVYEQWKSRAKNKKDIAEVRTFVNSLDPRWAKFIFRPSNGNATR